MSHPIQVRSGPSPRRRRRLARRRVALLASVLVLFVPNTGCQLIQQILGALTGGTLTNGGGGGLPGLGGGSFPGSNFPGTTPGATPGGFGPQTPGAGTGTTGTNTGSGQGGLIPGGGSSAPPVVGGSGNSDLDPPGNLGADDYDFRQDIQYSQVRELGYQGPGQDIPYIKDVMSHTDDHFTSAHGLTTMAHETAHGIHNMVNRYPNREFVYFERGYGAEWQTSRVPKNSVAQLLSPAARQLASGRVGTYLTGQQSFSDVDYLWDEWGAYIVGSRSGVEMAEAGKWTTGGQDVVDGAMDFLVFCAAGTLAVKQQNPQYFDPASATGKQFKAIFAAQAERSARWVGRGLKVPDFSRFHAGQLFYEFQRGTGQESEAVRTHLKEWMGAGWTKRVFGF